jgi:23S rRNA (uracil1939-C5)-methyltransferase
MVSANKKDARQAPFEPGFQTHANFDKLNSQAEGVARIEGFATFVPGVLPGESADVEVLRVSSNFARGKALRLGEASPFRQTPPCPVHLAPRPDDRTFGDGPFCGGCQLQMLDREKELEFKRELVADNLLRLGGLDFEVSPVSGGDPWRYRNKMAFALEAEQGRLRFGLRTHEEGGDVLAIPSCDIARPELMNVGEKVLEALTEEFGTSLVWDGNNGFVRGVTVRTHTGRASQSQGEPDRACTDPCTVVLFAVTNTDLELAERIVRALEPISGVRPYFSYSDPRSTSVYYDRTRFLNRLPGRAPRWGEGVFREEICAWHTTGDWETLVGPTSFLQVNDEMAQRLYGRVLDLPFEGRGFAVDAYCGVGILTRALCARFEDVMGIELDTQSIKLARTTSRRLGDCRVEWVAEPSEAVFAQWGKEKSSDKIRRPDLVVLDPPRKGCQQDVLQTLNLLKPADVVYISCHPAALARDLRTLCKKSFEVVRVEPFDLFPRTHHVETLVHLKAR